MFSTDNTDRIRRLRGRSLWMAVAVAAAALLVGGITWSRLASAAVPTARPEPHVRILTIMYTSHAGVQRSLALILPAWYGPRNHPSIPLVVSPHGRNGNGRRNAEYWGNLPAVGHFAVVNPDGMGRHLSFNSYGWKAQIDDLARMPEIVKAALPWVHFCRKFYVLGSSMGGQETLLLVARHPERIAGAVAMDSVTDLTRRYKQMDEVLKDKVEREVGYKPAESPALYAERSPLQYAREIASSGVPLQIWWSKKDRIVIDQAHQSGALYHALRRIGSRAAVTAYVGSWRHSHEMRASELLPIALERLGLLLAAPQLPHSVTCSDPTL